MRIIGLDIHRTFAEAVMYDGANANPIACVGMTREQLIAFAETLNGNEHVVVEALEMQRPLSRSWPNMLLVLPLQILHRALDCSCKDEDR